MLQDLVMSRIGKSLRTRLLVALYFCGNAIGSPIEEKEEKTSTPFMSPNHVSSVTHGLPTIIPLLSTTLFLTEGTEVITDVTDDISHVPITSKTPLRETEGHEIQEIRTTVSNIQRIQSTLSPVRDIHQTVPQIQETPQILLETKKIPETVLQTQKTSQAVPENQKIPPIVHEIQTTTPLTVIQDSTVSSSYPISHNLSSPPSSLLPLSPPIPPTITTTPSPASVVKRCCPDGFRMTKTGCVGDPGIQQPWHSNGTEQNEFFECKNGNIWSISKNNTMINKGRLIIPSHYILRGQGTFCLEEALGQDGADASNYYLCYSDPVKEYEKHCSDPTSCIRKCCPRGQVLKSMLCVEYGEELKLDIVDYDLKPIESESGKKVISEFPVCGSGYKMSSPDNESEEFYIMEEGDVYMPGSYRNYWSHDLYCVDHVLNNGVPNLTLHACYAPAQVPSNWLLLSPYFKTPALIISCIFLLITLIFYFCITELKNLQGLSLLSHVASLFLAELALLTLTWMPAHPPRGFCISTGFAIQLFFLWSFFWLNVICFDIWRYIGLTTKMVVMTGPKHGGSMGGRGAPYLWYMLYAWGTPIVIFVISLILYLLPYRVYRSLRPFSVTGKCWLTKEMEILAFFYGPIALLFLINLVLILHTGLRLYKAGDMFTCCPNSLFPNRSPAVAASHSFNRTHLQEFWQRFGIFSVMAICWIFEILSWKIGHADAWAFTDMLNCLQGFFVFVVFICNKNKRALVAKLLKTWKRKINICCKKKAGLGRKGTFYLTNVSGQGTGSSTGDSDLQSTSMTEVSCTDGWSGKSRSSNEDIKMNNADGQA
ncbi:G-protein coupled receptor Mth2-like [Oratosquilla oratoria]|uniref:G-protein coupled receptor Mth2-like n=1 Tax=Oratosquilla oratoria TaxID=337810 RepID=UPI003F75F1E4